MRKIFKPWLASALLVATMSALPPQVMAATPKDTLVVAKNIADIITFDPAEAFELTTGELMANIYDRIMMAEPENTEEIVGGVVESWEISNNGKTITFTMREGQKFHSGNPVRAEDVVWSLRRVVKLNKTPAFIITQFGWNADNVDELIKVVDGKAQITITEDLSPGLVLNALSATVGSVVDKETAMKHEVDGDMAYAWLKTNSAGSGAFELKKWKANELVTLQANKEYRHGAPKMKRMIMRHIAEPATQRLQLEKGDIDMARELQPDQVKGMGDNADISVGNYPKATLYYMALNVDKPELSHPKVWEAMRYLVDYEGMVNSFLAGQYKVHQAFWPEGLWAGLTDKPFSLNVDKAKALLAEAGIKEGMNIKIDTLNKPPFTDIAQSVQSALGKAGIQSEILTSEGKTLWPKYRARRHDIIIARWSPDYLDPHSNADAFAHNPDNRFEAKLTGKLTWRNAWDAEAVNAMTEKARFEQNLDERGKIYANLQKEVQSNSPFIVMFQQIEQVAMRSNVKGFVSGASFDLVFYRNVTKE